MPEIIGVAPITQLRTCVIKRYPVGLEVKLLVIRQSPSQFENRIMPQVYIRSIHVLLCTKSSILFAGGTGVWKISYVACGFSSIKIDYSDYPKS